MLALTEAAIRRSLVNCSRSEAAALTPPRDLEELDWSSLDVLGWRDAKAELRGYLVHETDDGVVGIALRAADEAERRLVARHPGVRYVFLDPTTSDERAQATAPRPES